MRRSHIVLPLLALAILPGCENGAPWGSGEEAPMEEVRDFGPTAAYGRRLVFLGPGGTLPTAAIFDFTALADSAAVRRGVRARLLTGDEWVTLADQGWELEAMREPWRIVPGGNLTLTVTDAGELGSLTVRGEPVVRLEPGPLLAESSPGAGTQLVLRQARLAVGDEVVRGMLLDSQLGRAVNPAAVPGPFAPDSAAGEDPVDPDADDDPAADSGAAVPPPPPGRPTPIARAGAEGFLLNNSGFYAVFTTSAGADIAWVRRAGREDIRRGVTLEPTAWSAADADAVQVPTAWRVRGPGSELTGELSAETTRPTRLPDLGDLTTLGYTVVSGWVEDGGVRRDVFGLIRFVR